MKKALLCVVAFVMLGVCSAQSTRYIVQFKNKAGTPFSLSQPLAYLSQKAIDRRTRYHITIDSADLPVNPAYIDSVRNAGAVVIINASKWLNSLSIKTSDAAALSRINNLPFVRKVTAIAARTANEGMHIDKRETGGSTALGANGITDYNYGASTTQVQLHNGAFLHHIGLHGEGMKIGLLDGGFYHYTTLHAFDSILLNNQVQDIYDFVAKDNSVVEDDAHGMECFSIIGANIPGQFVGTAPKALFNLYRTEEVATEYPIEEHNWVCGAERLDSAGGDVLSSSLGYTTFDDPALNHTYADMNGRVTMAANGAAIAARKGILVVVAAGNDGTNAWHYISTPADADSVMAVAAVDATKTPASFSSYGPSADGRVKPDVASLGVQTVIQSPSNTVASGNGTSFACPNIAGLAACLWQGFQELDNVKILNALRQSGSIANAPDNRIGYGIPDVKKAMFILLKQISSIQVTVTNCVSTITWIGKDMNMMKYEIERKIPGATSFVKLGETGGTGNNFTTHQYTFKDSLVNVSQGQVAYRIRQIIDTSAGSFSADYIDTASAELVTTCSVSNNNNNAISLLPNPARSQVNVKVITTDPIPFLTINLYDSKGSLVYKTLYNKPAGIIQVPLSLSRFAAGTYYVRAYNGQQLIGQQVLIKL